MTVKSLLVRTRLPLAPAGNWLRNDCASGDLAASAAPLPPVRVTNTEVQPLPITVDLSVPAGLAGILPAGGTTLPALPDLSALPREELSPSVTLAPAGGVKLNWAL